MSQTAKVLQYLETHPEGITPLESLRHLGVMRLSGRILELRRDGHAITSAWETTPSGARIARYRLSQGRQCPACHRMHPVGTTCAVAA